MTGNAYLDRKARNGIGAAGRASEKRLAKALGAKLKPASGAKDHSKGDMDLGEVLIEAKSTTNDSLSLKLDWLLKIHHEALGQSKTPAVAITFTDGTGRAVRGGEWVCVPLNIWNRVFEK